ncbi:FAD-linked oxidase C-terminal domain-containing protein [Chitinimonas koreensis]|uniref:FAD-linked oxidase C-terminal domain-containing protein n=1 Tax=Chitinimonas koreensis TaxID=356302 RepID=UPI00040BA840|nr:FAD-linked oxidase C-terminal domain-containing protein [Chitinimonas koreensis]QNM95846.1 FAD-binding protein [Chitinimonas koreensis]
MSTDFLAQLRTLLPADAVIADRERLRAFECDALSAYRTLPLAVALPGNEAEAAAVLRLAHAHGVPVVARGSGTGLSGGAMPVEGGLLLGLSRMKAIVQIDALARLARVQPGVRNQAISEAAAPYGLYYAPDPSSQIACSIGGNVAENAGGIHCLKYGLTVHNVLGLRALTVEGELLELGGATLDSPSDDLLSLLIGSEGLLAVVTEVTVKLLPRPQLARVILASFPTVGAAADGVASLIAGGLIPAALEMMDQPTVRAVEDFLRAGYPVDAAAMLLCEADGTPEEVAADIERMSAILRAAGADGLRVSQSEAERQTFWAGRKAAFPAAAKLSPDYYCMDGSIPRAAIGRVLEGIAALGREHGLACINVFHAGDGNLHPLILFDANQPGQLAAAERYGTAIAALCVAEGGAISGEHGIGVEKLDAMCAQFNAAELGRFAALKAAFDPRGLLNPGKLIPTLHRCAEYGRMHVHGGQLPHPDLPRF